MLLSNIKFARLKSIDAIQLTKLFSICIFSADEVKFICTTMFEGCAKLSVQSLGPLNSPDFPV